MWVGSGLTRKKSLVLLSSSARLSSSSSLSSLSSSPSACAYLVCLLAAAPLSVYASPSSLSSTRKGLPPISPFETPSDLFFLKHTAFSDEQNYASGWEERWSFVAAASGVSCHNCSQHNGHCVEITTNSSVCKCYPGFGGNGCYDDVTLHYVDLKNQMMATLLVFTFSYGIWILVWRMNRAKLSRTRIVLWVCLASAVAELYYGMDLLSDKCGGSFNWCWILGYWCCGLYYFLNFFLHALCFALYNAIARHNPKLKGLVSMSNWPMILTLGLIFLVEFGYVCLYITLVACNLLPDKYDTYVAGYLVRHLVRTSSYFLFSLILAVSCAIMFFRIYRISGSFVLPRRQEHQQFNSEFVSRTYEHPGNELDTVVLSRTRVFMVLFIICEFVNAGVSAWETTLVAFKGRNQWYSLATITLREISFLMELVGSIWAFGHSSARSKASMIARSKSASASGVENTDDEDADLTSDSHTHHTNTNNVFATLLGNTNNPLANPTHSITTTSSASTERGQGLDEPLTGGGGGGGGGGTATGATNHVMSTNNSLGSGMALNMGKLPKSRRARKKLKRGGGGAIVDTLHAGPGVGLIRNPKMVLCLSCVVIILCLAAFVILFLTLAGVIK